VAGFVKFSILAAFRRKLVAVLAIVGVSLGSGLLVALLSFSEGIEARFNQAFQQVSGTITVLPEGGNILGRMIGAASDPLPESYAKEIAGLEGVETTLSYVVAQIPSSALDLPPLMGLGLTGIGDGDAGLLLSPTEKIIEGRSFEEEGEVIVGKHTVADTKMMGREITVGDRFRVPVGQTGESVELVVVGIFETGSPTNDYGFVGQESLARKIAQVPEGKVSGIRVRVGDPSRVAEIAEQIGALFEDRDSRASALVSTDILESMNSFRTTFRGFLLAIALVSAIAGGMAVMVVMLLTGFERRKEFGVLKASGWSNGSVILSVLITSVTLALMGSLLGLGLGAGSAILLESYLEQGIAAFTWELFAWAFGVGLGTGLVGGIVPALNAARVSPIETLRSE